MALQFASSGAIWKHQFCWIKWWKKIPPVAAVRLYYRKIKLKLATGKTYPLAPAKRKQGKKKACEWAHVRHKPLVNQWGRWNEMHEITKFISLNVEIQSGETHLAWAAHTYCLFPQAIGISPSRCGGPWALQISLERGITGPFPRLWRSHAGRSGQRSSAVLKAQLAGGRQRPRSPATRFCAAQLQVWGSCRGDVTAGSCLEAGHPGRSCWDADNVGDVD